MPQQIIKGRLVEALKTTASWAVDAGHDVHVPARSPQALRPRDGLTVTGSIQAGARRTAGINKYSRSIRRTLVLTLAAAVSLLSIMRLSKAYGGVAALRDASLEVDAGESSEAVDLFVERARAVGGTCTAGPGGPCGPSMT